MLIIALLCALYCSANAFRIVTPVRLLQRNRVLMSDIENNEVESVQEVEVKSHQVFVGNLPFDVEEDAINELIFQTVGDTCKPVKPFNLIRDRKTGRSKGYGFLSYDAQDNADGAVAALSAMEIGGRGIKVDHYDPSAVKVRTPRPNTRENSVFIGNLDFSVTEDEIRDMCNDILGESVVSRIRLATDRETGQPRGFGHIDLVSSEEAVRAVQELSGVSLRGRQLRVDAARRKEDMPARRERVQFDSANTLFLGNLAWDVTEELLKEMLDDVVGPGLYLQVRLAVDNDTGRSRGYAHVDFKDSLSVQKALTELNGLEVLGRQLRVDVAGARARGSGSGERRTQNNVESL